MYRVRSGSIDALMHRVDRDLAEAFVQEPGFIAYQVAQTGPRTVASITTFHEREQAEASNELAAEWVADALADFSEVLRFSGRDDEERAVRNEALRLYERKGDIVSAGRLRSLLA